MKKKAIAIIGFICIIAIIAYTGKEYMQTILINFFNSFIQ